MDTSVAGFKVEPVFGPAAFEEDFGAENKSIF